MSSESGIGFPPRRVLWMVVVTSVVVLVLGSVVVGESISGGAIAVAIAAGLAAAAGIWGVWVSVRGACLRVTVGARSLSVPRLAWGRDTLALAEVAGLGMRYAAAGRGSGWRALVWPAEGKRRRLGIAPPSHGAPPDRRNWRRPGPATAPALDWDYVADSPAGRALLEIGRRVNEVQGPGGPWATRHREREVIIPGGAETAFWSPSGQIGVLAGAHEDRR